MKSLNCAPRTLLMIVLTACLWIGCGGDEPEPTTATASAQPAAQPAGTPIESTSDATTTLDKPMETTAPTTLSLTPGSIDPDKPIPVGALHAAYFAWKDQPVVVGGYLQSATRRTRINRRITLTDTPGGEAQLINCEVTEPSKERVETDQPVVVRGTYSHFAGATNDGLLPVVELKDCEVVSIGEPFAADVKAMPGQSAPMPARAFHNAITGWQGQELMVVGYYHSSGYSSAIDKTKINLRTGRTSATAVGCQIPGKDVTPENLADNREGVVMRGTVGEPTWDQVILEDCTFLNR